MRTITALLVGLPTLVAAQSDDYGGKYTPCVDYYKVGESNCAPLASTPLMPLQPVVGPQQSPQNQAKQQDAVSQYLENYGKPPREFVEFYLNPSPENAQKWVSTYNQMVQRSQALSRSWSQADVLYRQQQEGSQSSATIGGSVLPPVQDLGVPLAQDKLQTATQVAPGAPAAAAPKQPVHLGAFGENGQGGGFGQPVHLTYYFSATCPYCAKMTPALASLYNEMKDKLVLTCVDVTPLSATHRPSADNILGKLPCNWRLPEEGEVERETIQQTPTLHVRSPSGKLTRLSGYLPPEQLKGYVTQP